MGIAIKKIISEETDFAVAELDFNGSILQTIVYAKQSDLENALNPNPSLEILLQPKITSKLSTYSLLGSKNSVNYFFAPKNSVSTYFYCTFGSHNES